MKKKVIVIFIVFIIPVSVFAEFQIGPLAAYKFPITSSNDLPALSQIGIQDFWFGGDVRLKANIFQATLLGLYLPGNSDLVPVIPNRFSLGLTGGIAFDLAIVRLGLGIGPAWIFSLNNSNINPVDFGTFFRFNTDLMFGPVALSLALGSQINLTGKGSLMDFNNFAVWAGLALLFRIG